MMDRDTLERLATDRALGALGHDAEQLLQAYLAVDSQAAAMVGQIGHTVRVARAAMGGTVPRSLPAFPVAGFQQIERWRRRMRVLSFAGALAACLIMGIGVGRMHVPVTVVPTVTMHDAKAPVSPIVSADNDASRYASEAGFWSIERLRRQHDQRESRSSAPSEKSIAKQWQYALNPT